MKLFSVIIPAKNEGKNIERCLKAIRRQNLKPIECIFVDNGSTDDTKKIAEHNGAKVIYLTGKNISELLNIGASRSKANYFAFLDADCEPDPNWLFFADKAFVKEEIDAVGKRINNQSPLILEG